MTKEKPGTLNLLIGSVGAGKTTFAGRRIARTPAVFLDLDACMVRLYGNDTRPSENVIDWYFERRERCRGLLWDVAGMVLSSGGDVFLELGLVTVAEREEFYSTSRSEEFKMIVYLLDAPRAVRRERVAERNRSAGPHTQIVPSEFFERASDAWQHPTEAERAAWSIIDV